MNEIILRLGDCLDRMKELPDDSIGASISDPPYDLISVSRGGSPRNNVADPSSPWSAGAGAGTARGFMGKTWDGTGIAFAPDLWNEVFRVLSPGGVVKAFGGTRTFHRMAVAMEQAGLVDIHLEAWTYGSGFPKSMNIAKALDKMAGAERGTKRVPYTGNALLRSGGQNTRPWMEEALKKGYHEMPDDSPVTDEAKAWAGWGTALKPAWEPVLVGRKP